MAPLARFRSVLRRLLPGKEPRTVLARQALGRIADHHVARGGATPDSVLARLERVSARKLTDEQRLQLRLALERDLGTT